MVAKEIFYKTYLRILIRSSSQYKKHYVLMIFVEFISFYSDRTVNAKK